ncbi:MULTISPECIES: hypothetical protein [Paenibacillus]|uniref:Uncharacterized protein n=1 Tax=Paenibacillus polymyxa TaxID=1406 RepID=A0AAP4A0S0_PAEPO|nr:MULTISPECIES: hypothetical protein [Paenibacillus]APB75608.1 SpoVR family protein [Paenibacillus polymyxa]MDH2330464.1 hypothetical protein [Paenibacillus polymyxa]OMF32341.1 hypothetical protein BK134_10965 [Paenibacillus peoriae]POR25559.1 hypothetical protein CG775_21820 [Paenibacillus polymyxa]
MKKSIIALAAGTVLLGALSVPSLGFAEQAQTSANISSERSYTPTQEDKKWVTGIKGSSFKKSEFSEAMKDYIPQSMFYIQGSYMGTIYLYEWKTSGNKVYPLFRGYLYSIIPKK